MGFSTSGAVVIILIGFLVAVSVIVPTIFEVGATTGEAFGAQTDQLRDQQNTDITIESFKNETNEEEDHTAVLNVTNEGANSLSVAGTDLVVNGEYYPVNGTDETTTIVAGPDDERSNSDIWSPGTHLEIEIDDTDLETEITGEDDRVRITTERGIAAGATITEPESDEEETTDDGGEE
ncbi:flagellin (plasmid) [Natrialbaceae archaeon A-arb3/5]